MKTHCDYPDCKCPFDAPADPSWCALGLPTETPAPYGYTYETNETWTHFTRFKVPSDAYDDGTLIPLYTKNTIIKKPDDCRNGCPEMTVCDYCQTENLGAT